MDKSLECLLDELERFGAANDKSISNWPRRMLNITRSGLAPYIVQVQDDAGRAAQSGVTPIGPISRHFAQVHYDLASPAASSSSTRSNSLNASSAAGAPQ